MELRQLVTVEHKSLPSWERGLKFEIDKICIRIELVAPLVGAWIEIGIFWRRAGL